MDNKNIARHLLKPLLSAGFAFSYTFSLCASAQSLDIANAPLQATGSTQPNLMIVLDSSLSMGSMSPRIDGNLRLEIVQEAARGLLDSIPDNSMRVGYATFDGNQSNQGRGAKVRNNIAPLTPTWRQSIKSQISGTAAEHYTPLAEAVMDIGRYFTYGYSSDLNLTLHPGPDNPFEQAESSAAVSNVFSREPAFANNQSAPTGGVNDKVVEYYCQKNFMILLTDGEPTYDRDVSDNLKDYATPCDPSVANCSNKLPNNLNSSKYLPDVAAALYDMDLRPDVDDAENNEVKNNVTSYFVGFADPNLADNQLLEDAGRLGGGDYIYTANAEELTDAFNDAIGSIANSIGSQSSVSFNSTSLDIGSVIYSAQFDTTDNSGRLFARAMNPDTGRIASELWDAGEKLALRSAARQIITTLDGQGVPFTVSAVDGSTRNYTISVDLNRLDGGPGRPTVTLNVGGVPIDTASNNDVTLSGTTSDISGDISVGCDTCSGTARVEIVSATLGTVAQAVGVTLNSNGASHNLDSLGDSDPTVFTPHRADLRIDARTGSADDLWQDRLNYIRGTTTKDGDDGFRRRGRFNTGEASGSIKRLGDIVHSTPIYVGKPELNWPADFGTNQKSYAQFQIDKASRTPLVYVGANDGMLHAFKASDGEEVFAYVPSLVLSAERNDGLHAFTSSVYDHRYYVDQTPAVSDVFINSDWHTVLVGGLRGGGKGYFALDVTNPDVTGTNKLTAAEANAANIVLWEFDGGDDTGRANMGFGFSEVQIAKLNNNKWAAIFGNGYNSESGMAGLFIVYIEDGINGWSAGDWKFISTAVGATDSGRKNGLSSPRLIDLNGDKKVDRVYAGDLLGNMWAFDLCAAGDDGVCANSDGSWDVDYKLFGQSGAGSGEPHNAITAAPLVARNTVVTDGAAPNVLVLFGTGQYLNSQDLTEDDPGAFYVVWDKGAGGVGVSDLVARTLVSAGGKRSIADDADDPIDWTSENAKSGWYMPLADGAPPFAAERVVSAAALRRNTVFFSTIIPNPQPCASSGTGWLMSLDFRTGLPEVGLQRPVTDFNNDGQINEEDAGFVGKEFDNPPCTGDSCGDDDAPPGMPGQSGFIGDVRCTPGSAGGVVCDDIDVGDEEREGRLSWEEFSPL